MTMCPDFDAFNCGTRFQSIWTLDLSISLYNLCPHTINATTTLAILNSQDTIKDMRAITIVEKEYMVDIFSSENLVCIKNESNGSLAEKILKSIKLHGGEIERESSNLTLRNCLADN